MTAPAHTVVHTHGGGRLGNQVIRWAHWLAWVRAHPDEVRVVDLGFWRYARYFHHWHDRQACVIPDGAPLLDGLAGVYSALPEWLLKRAEWRLQHLVFAAGRRWPGAAAVALDDPKKESIDLESPAFRREVGGRRLTVCSGWKIASWPRVAEQVPALRELFRPHARWAGPAREFVADLHRRYDYLIGLQIRQSDYRDWNRGRFYFPTSRYVEWIRQLVLLHPGRRVAFVVASEERQDPAAFAGLPVYFATGTRNAGGHWFSSWLELALCDCVVSPPSTFSATAAFLGAVPLWPISTVDQRMAFDQVLSNALVDAAQHPAFSQCVQ